MTGKGHSTVPIAATPETEEGPLWASKDPSTSTWVSYDRNLNAAVERFYQQKAEEFNFKIQGNKFRIDFAEKRQYNQRGGFREIQRTVTPAAHTPSPAMPAPPTVVAATPLQVVWA